MATVYPTLTPFQGRARRKRSSLSFWRTHGSLGSPYSVQIGRQGPGAELELLKSVVEPDMEPGPLVAVFYTCPWLHIPSS